MIKRGVPVKNLDVGELVPATGQSVRRTVKLTQGIAQDAAKKIIKAVKDGGFKKAQATIQGDEIRVTEPVPGRAAGDHRHAQGPGFRHRAQVWQLPRLSGGAASGCSSWTAIVVSLAAAGAVAWRAARRRRRRLRPRRSRCPGRPGRRRAGARWRKCRPSPDPGRPRGRRRRRHGLGHGGPQRERSRRGRGWPRFRRVRSGG